MILYRFECNRTFLYQYFQKSFILKQSSALFFPFKIAIMQSNSICSLQMHFSNLYEHKTQFHSHVNFMMTIVLTF